MTQRGHAAPPELSWPSRGQDGRGGGARKEGASGRACADCRDEQGQDQQSRPLIFPDSEITKGELADHYAARRAIMLPWVGTRPISLVRCPQGRAKKCFFQKHDAGSFGEHVQPCRRSARRMARRGPYLYVDDADGLLTCVQMGSIEFHGWGARIEDVEKARPAGVRSRPGRRTRF